METTAPIDFGREFSACLTCPRPHPLPPATTTPTNRDPAMLPHFVFPTTGRCRKLAAWRWLQVAASGRVFPRPECLRARTAPGHLDAPEKDVVLAAAAVAVRRMGGRKAPSIDPGSAGARLQTVMQATVHNDQLDEPAQPRLGASAPMLIPVL